MKTYFMAWSDGVQPGNAIFKDHDDMTATQVFNYMINELVHKQAAKRGVTLSRITATQFNRVD